MIHGRPTPFWERAAKWSRRHKAAAASVVVGWVTITAMIVGGFVYQQQMSNWVLAQENTGSGLIDGAREAVERDELTESKIRLGTFRGTIQREPRLRVLLARVDKAVASLGGKLADLDQLASRVASHGAERARLEKFRDLWNQASVYDIQLNGLDLATNQTSALRVARAALALFAAPNSGDAWALAALPESLTQAEQAEVAEGCYGLLLSLAEAEPTPAEGLRRLDEAARLRQAPRLGICGGRFAFPAQADRPTPRKNMTRLAALRQPPRSITSWSAKSYKRGDLSAAMSEFDAALELQPSQFWSQCLRSVCCVQLRQFSEAKTGFTACLQRDDRQPWLFLLRGFSSYQLGVRARMRIEKLPLDEQASRTEAKLQLDAAAADYRRAFELLDSEGGRDLRFPLLVNRGVLRLERGDFEAAEADLNAAKRLDASRLEPLLALAQVYLKLERPDQASAQFSRAIALEPDEAALYRGRADVQLARKKPTVTERASALGDLETAIKLEKPSNPELASHDAKRARLLAFAHRDVEALAACDAAIKIKPDLEDAHRVRIDLLIKRKQYDDVNRSCSAIIGAERRRPSCTSCARWPVLSSRTSLAPSTI